MLEQQLERLARAGFQILPAFEIVSHYVLEREGFVALVEKRAEGGFGQPGSPGLLIEGAFAALVWHGGDPFFVAQGTKRRATAREVEDLRRFDSDLRAALEGTGPE
jgi:hypothetical protein